MSAAELRAAATRLRALAESATPGPWLVEDDSWDGWQVIMPPDGIPGVSIVAGNIPQGDDEGECDSHYIAAMNPLVGLALADLLDDVAEHAESNDAYDGFPPAEVITGYAPALTIARLINGSAHGRHAREADRRAE